MIRNPRYTYTTYYTYICMFCLVSQIQYDFVFFCLWVFDPSICFSEIPKLNEQSLLPIVLGKITSQIISCHLGTITAIPPNRKFGKSSTSRLPGKWTWKIWRCVSLLKNGAFFPGSHFCLLPECLVLETLEIRLVLKEKEWPKFQNFGDWISSFTKT